MAGRMGLEASVDSNAYAAEILARWLKDNRLQGIPRKSHHKQIVLEWLTCKFAPDQRYDTDQVNEIRLLYRRVKILEDQYTRAKEIVTGLRRLHAGTANEPVFEELPKSYGDDTLPMPYGLTVRTDEAKEAMG